MWDTGRQLTCLEGHPPRAWARIPDTVLLKRWDIRAPQVQASLHEMPPGVTDIVRAIGCEKRRISKDWTSWGSLLGGRILIRNLREEKRRKETSQEAGSCVDPTTWVLLIYIHSTGPSLAPDHSTPSPGQSLPSRSVSSSSCYPPIHFKFNCKILQTHQKIQQIMQEPPRFLPFWLHRY